MLVLDWACSSVRLVDLGPAARLLKNREFLIDLFGNARFRTKVLFFKKEGIIDETD
jgi:hypothetical protein